MGKVLTVSIAAYNVEQYIENTLASLCACKHKDLLEVFIVDDGGKDKTLTIARKYEEKYPNTFHAVHKENGGYGSVINTSVRMATGKYFKQLDGDDWFDADTLDAFLELLSEIDEDYVFTSVVTNHEVDGSEVITDFFDYLKEGRYLFEEIQFKRFITMHSTTLKTQLLKDADLQITEHSFYTDLELVYKPLPMANSFFVWHHPVYHYRVGVEGQSGSIAGIKKHADEHIARVKDLIDLYVSMKRGSRKKLLGLRVIKQVSNQCRVFSVVGIKEWTHVKVFYEEFKIKCPELVKKTMASSKRLNILFRTHYLLFPLFVIWDRIKKDEKPV